MGSMKFENADTDADTDVGLSDMSDVYVLSVFSWQICPVSIRYLDFVRILCPVSVCPDFSISPLSGNYINF